MIVKNIIVRMPKTNLSLPREEKLAKILDCAEELFRTRGYKSTTRAAVARAAGVAPNAIYWYLPSKDHLLVAILERWRVGMWDRLQHDWPATGIRGILSEIVNADRNIRPLKDAAHQRAPLSPVVADYHQRSHDGQRDVLSGLLAPICSSKEEAELLADAIDLSVEGTLSHEALGRPTEKIVELVALRLIGADPRL